MANDLRGRPWIIDTTGNPVPNAPFRTITTGFVFRDYTTGTSDLCTIKDTVRNIVIAELPGNSAKTPVGEAWYIPQHILGLGVTLTSGKVEIIVK